MDTLLDRHLVEEVAGLLTHFPAVELGGARQVGKSTLIRLLGRLVPKPVSVFTLDDPEVRGLAEHDPRGFLGQRPGDLLAIDEFQRVPALTLALKAAIDADRSPSRFLITGSANIMATQQSADSLAGRVVGTQLFGFSQGELLGRRDDFVAGLLDGGRLERFTSSLGRSDYVDLISRGSMPEAVSLPFRHRITWLSSYLERLLSRDILDLTRLSDPLRLRSLLAALAATQGSETVVSRVGSAINLNATTTSNYLDLLRALFLIERVPPWTPNLLKREVGRSKYLVTDSALALMLARTSPANLLDMTTGSALGGFLEGFVAAELLRQRGWASVRFDLAHYRSPDGREIDVILELDDGRVVAIEVKAAQSVSRHDYRHLAWLREKLGDQLVAGVVLTMDTLGRRLQDNLYALPVSALWML
ncbi:ATP-binding protein [Tessaracoccus massiliensis]|uniref:ATP-binding protein n=1 Tax=Tessaracoccus massiliensis TaxID=1522311 RepID=UPI00058E33B4|nr:ATP-binding protein [Tessaracoccus massiliensis]